MRRADSEMSPGKMDAEGATIPEEEPASGASALATEAAGHPERAAQPAGASTLARGSLVGRYVVLERLGRGGMGVVYSAYDPELDRRVAIKLLHSDFSGDQRRGARLRREAQALARLSHPNVVTVFEVGVLDASVYVVMEYIAGQTIAKYVESLGDQAGAQWQTIVEAYVKAGRGLLAAHEAGLVHRDFKPDNVMVREDGRIVVLDFGLARSATDRDVPSETTPGTESQRLPNEDITRAGAVLGTPAYMAPEQMDGRPSPTADQFSFCVALYEGLYGHRPFAGQRAPELLRNVSEGRVRAPPEGSVVPAWLAEVVGVGLRARPEDRHPSMQVLLQRLENRPRRRRQTLWLTLAATGIAGVGVVVGAGLQPKASPCSVLDPTAWGPKDAARVREGLLGRAGPLAEATADRVIPMLDDYAAALATQRHQSCVATRIDGEQSQSEFAARDACLERAHRALHSLAEHFSTADETTRMRAVSLVDGLPELDECLDMDRVRRSMPMPDSPEDRATAARLLNQVDRVYPLLTSARADEAEALAVQTLAEAEALGHGPLTAIALAKMGQVHSYRGKPHEARRDYRAALRLAEIAGVEQTVFSLLMRLAYVEGVSGLYPAFAAERLARGEALLARLGKPPVDAVTLLRLRGSIAVREDRRDEACDDFREGIAISKAAGHPDRHQLQVMWEKLASTLVDYGTSEEATEAAARAEALGAELLGPLHPDLAVLATLRGRILANADDWEGALHHFNRGAEILQASGFEGVGQRSGIANAQGRALAALGRWDEAIVMYEHALETATESLGREARAVASIESNLGGILRRRGRADEAVRHHEHGLEVLRALRDGKGKEVRFAYDNLGDSLRVAGRLEDAARAYNDSLAVEGIEPNKYVAYPTGGLGLVYEALGDTELARTYLERSIALVDADDSEQSERNEAGQALFGLARLLWDAGETDRARALAARAEATWTLPGQSIERDALAAWRREHNVPR